jgi:hypothetical protein
LLSIYMKKPGSLVCSAPFASLMLRCARDTCGTLVQGTTKKGGRGAALGFVASCNRVSPARG